MMTMGKAIKAMREQDGLSVKELAAKAGIDSALLAKYEADELMPQLDVLVKVASALGAEIVEMGIGDSTEEIGKDAPREKMPFADKLRGLRKMYNLSESALADALGLTKDEICEYESGESVPDITAFEKIADFFNVTADFLLDRDVVSKAEKKFFDFAYDLEHLFALSKRGAMSEAQYKACRNRLITDYAEDDE